MCSWHSSALHLVAAYYINEVIFQVGGAGRERGTTVVLGWSPGVYPVLYLC